MFNTLVGTSGFAYRDWLGTVYPKKLPASERLEFYSRYLTFLELNSSYYAFPTAKTIDAMIRRTPADFSLSVKAHRSLTHEIDPTALNRGVSQLSEALQPAIERESLRSTLFQFPFRFHRTRPNRHYLAALVDAATESGLKPAIEFRSHEWLCEDVYAESARRCVPVVWVDAPDLRGLPSLDIRPTASIQYLRLHGRNADTWWNGTNESRYHYRYSTQELLSLCEAVESVASAEATHRIETLIVAFNNHFEGNAFANALEFRELLSRTE